MHDAHSVRSLERIRHRRGQLERLDLRDGSPLQSGTQRLTRHELHDEDVVLVQAQDLVHDHDMRVVQGRQCARFGEQACTQTLGAPLPVEHFEGDVATETLVARAPDFPRSAGAQRLEDPKMPDDLSFPKNHASRSVRQQI